jgi:hypothetical protein
MSPVGPGHPTPIAEFRLKISVFETSVLSRTQPSSNEAVNLKSELRTLQSRSKAERRAIGRDVASYLSTI